MNSSRYGHYYPTIDRRTGRVRGPAYRQGRMGSYGHTWNRYARTVGMMRSVHARNPDAVPRVIDRVNARSQISRWIDSRGRLSRLRGLVARRRLGNQVLQHWNRARELGRQARRSSAVPVPSSQRFRWNNAAQSRNYALREHAALNRFNPPGVRSLTSKEWLALHQGDYASRIQSAFRRYRARPRGLPGVGARSGGGQGGGQSLRVRDLVRVTNTPVRRPFLPPDTPSTPGFRPRFGSGRRPSFGLPPDTPSTPGFRPSFPVRRGRSFGLPDSTPSYVSRRSAFTTSPAGQSGQSGQTNSSRFAVDGRHRRALSFDSISSRSGSGSSSSGSTDPQFSGSNAHTTAYNAWGLNRQAKNFIAVDRAARRRVIHTGHYTLAGWISRFNAFSQKKWDAVLSIAVARRIPFRDLQQSFREIFYDGKSFQHMMAVNNEFAEVGRWAAQHWRLVNEAVGDDVWPLGPEYHDLVESIERYDVRKAELDAQREIDIENGGRILPLDVETPEDVVSDMASDVDPVVRHDTPVSSRTRAAARRAAAAAAVFDPELSSLSSAASRRQLARSALDALAAAEPPPDGDSQRSYWQSLSSQSDRDEAGARRPRQIPGHRLVHADYERVGMRGRVSPLPAIVEVDDDDGDDDDVEFIE